jgi:hypothetical protein
MSSISKLFKHVGFSLDGLTLVKSNEKDDGHSSTLSKYKAINSKI